MSVTNTFANDRNFPVKKCPNAIEIKCVQNCAQWGVDLQIKNKNTTQSHKISSNAVCTRNFKESLCKLLMSSNNNENSLKFANLKENYGKPYIGDIENLKPNLPIDQTIVNLNSLGPEFFSFLVEIDLKKEKKDSLKMIRKITPEFDVYFYEVLINVYIVYYIG